MQTCTLTMTVAREFVLSRREDPERPVDKGIAWLKEKLGDKVTIESATLTELVATLCVNDRVDLAFFARSTALDLERAMRKLYGLSSGATEFAVWDSLVSGATPARPSEETVAPAPAHESKRPETKRAEPEADRDAMLLYYDNATVIDFKQMAHFSWICDPADLALRYESLVRSMLDQDVQGSGYRKRRTIPEARDFVMEQENGSVIRLTYAEVGILYAVDALSIRLGLMAPEIWGAM